MPVTVKLPPGYGPWEHWLLTGRHPAARPATAPHRIPREWFALYAHRHPAKPKPPKPPKQRPGALRGIWVMTAWDPAAALRFKDAVDGAIVTGEHDWCTRSTADAIRGVGLEVNVWESGSLPLEGDTARDRLGATAYYGQAETQAQLAAVLALPLREPWGFVGNPGATDGTNLGLVVDERGVRLWPNRDLVAEAYYNVDARFTPEAIAFEAENRGVPHPAIIVGLYDAASEKPNTGRRVPLRAYPPIPPECPALVLYLAETATDDDIAYCRELKAAGRFPR